MNLAEKIQEEIELSEFYADRNGAVNIMRIFREWLRNHEDCDPCVSSIDREIRRAGGNTSGS